MTHPDLIEIFKDFNWYDWDYAISNLWSVFSLKKWKFKLKPFLYRNWYHSVSFWKKWVHRKYMIHRIVAMTFIPNPENKKTVNHINGIKTDNRVENLEWSTQSENSKHAWDTWLLKSIPNKYIEARKTLNPNYKKND